MSPFWPRWTESQIHTCPTSQEFAAITTQAWSISISRKNATACWSWRTGANNNTNKSEAAEAEAESQLESLPSNLSGVILDYVEIVVKESVGHVNEH
jgi:hypothetical protein